MNRKPHSQETKDKISIARKLFYANGGKHPRSGVTLSEETRRKIGINQRGAKNRQWKGGRFHATNGYVWVYNPGNPMASKVSPVGYVLEHRLVMSWNQGRPLQRSEVVHHIDGVRDNNDISNLVLTNSSDHVSHHNKERVHTDSSKKKHSEVAKKMVRGKGGRFTHKTT